MTLREQIGHEKREKDELQSALELEVAGHNRLRKAAQKVYDGLNARLDYAAKNGLPHPVFVGIAELHDALGKE